MIDERQRLPDLIANLRDLGGIRLGDAHVVRPNRLLRSAALVHLPGNSLDALTMMFGPGAYFDLRTDLEVERDGGADELVDRGWQWRRLPVQDPIDGEAPAERYRAALPRYVAVARQIARALPSTKVAVIGCSLGKDRTGLAVALLLHWLGAAESDIAADFLLSNACLAAQRDLLPPRWRTDGSEFSVVPAEPCLAALALAEALAPLKEMRAECTELREALAIASVAAQPNTVCDDAAITRPAAWSGR
jgi:hypothetical protein